MFTALYVQKGVRGGADADLILSVHLRVVSGFVSFGGVRFWVDDSRKNSASSCISRLSLSPPPPPPSCSRRKESRGG